MSRPEESSKPGCPGSCPACPEGGQDAPPCKEGALSGWRLAAMAVLAFLLPLALAVVGAVLGGSDEVRQLAGAAIGLAVGVAIAVIGARWIRRAAKENP